MLTWRIYYSDGSTYSSEDGPVELAPTVGVQVVLQYSRAAQVERLYYKHFYVWSAQYDCWLPIGDQRAPGDGHFGLVHYLMTPGWKKVLNGESLPYEAFERVLDRAVRDPDFQNKSAILPTEEGAPR
jgi:hypothetical protein